MTYRNIQAMRGIAALMVVASHLFWPIATLRSHWAKPFFTAIGPAGVDIFFVISGFIIYHVMQRATAGMEAVGAGRAAYVFAMKRFIRIYPLYWLALLAACLVMAWAPPAETEWRQPWWKLLTLIDGLPNYRVNVAWTLCYEVYFYAVATASLAVFRQRAIVGLVIWFGLIVLALPWSQPRATAAEIDYAFAPILLEFAFGVAVALLVERGRTGFARTSLLVAIAWFAAGTWILMADPASYRLRLACWGIPAALVIYGVVALERRQCWIAPRALQYLGDASFSLYLWHLIAFEAVAAAYDRLGWTGPLHPLLLTAIMALIGVGTGLLSYHYVEKPLLRRLGQHFIGQRVASNTLGPEVRAGNLAA